MSIIGFVLSIITLLVFTSCASEYQIEGNSSVSRLDGKMLFLKISSGTKMINIDSAEVVHGLFQMQGEMDSVVIASLYMDDQSIMPLVIEPGNIQIQIDNVNITVAGTPLNDKLYGFIGKKNALDDRAYEIERNESRTHLCMESGNRLLIVVMSGIAHVRTVVIHVCRVSQFR